MNDVFGPESYLTSIVWKSKSGGANDSGNVAVDHEYIAAYCRKPDSNCLQNDLYAVATTRYNLEDEKGRYALRRLDQQNLSYSKALDYDLIGPDGTVYKLEHKDPNNPNAIWRWSKARVAEHMGELVFKDGHVYTKIYEQKGSKARSLFVDDRFGRTRSGSTELRALLGGDYFSNPKPTCLLKTLLSMGTAHDEWVLDFFSGSASLADAAMQLNLEDSREIKTILVQLPETITRDDKAAKVGYKNICEIGKERIRRAGKKIAAEVEESNRQLKLGEEPKNVPDIGFRVLKIDSSNFEDVSAEPGEYSQDAMFRLADNLKLDRTPDDLIIQVMLKKQIELSAPIEKLDIDGCTVFSVDNGRLVACFDRDVPVEVMTAMAKMEPDYAVMRDASFAGDDAVSNFAEIFKNYSFITEVEVI